MDAAFVRRAEAFLGKVLAADGFRISNAEQISGNGLSRSVIRFGATSAEQPQERGYVLLLEQATSPVAPNRDAEFAALVALHGVPGIAVAPAFWVEPDPAPLGSPFLLTGLLPGTTNPRALLKPDHLPHAKHLVQQSYEMLGRLAALDVATLGLGAAFSVPGRADVWRVELDRAEAVIRDAACPGLNVTEAALRFLRRNRPPAPKQLSVVHGDYRLGNYLFEPHGVTGVIDWEMVHLGDALEDLAWSFLPLWEFAARPGQVGGFLSRQEAEAAWSAASGLTVDRAALDWWTVFCHVKAIGIWTTARRLFASGATTDVMPALVGYAMVEKQESFLAPLLRGGTR